MELDPYSAEDDDDATGTSVELWTDGRAVDLEASGRIDDDEEDEGAFVGTEGMRDGLDGWMGVVRGEGGEGGGSRGGKGTGSTIVGGGEGANCAEGGGSGCSGFG